MDFVRRKNEENLKITAAHDLLEERLHVINEDEAKTCSTPKLTEIQQFYNGISIFITGATGFLGKVLMEKLLRTCPEIATIYILIRPKKGKNIHTRFDEIIDDTIFDNLRTISPKFRHKLFAISGDCKLADLGLSLTDRQLLKENINIIFHAAATVRFDEKLKLALAINVHGTRDILNLAREMSNLRVIIHVSTAYANCHLQHIDEKFYKYSINYDDLDCLMEKFDDKTIDEVTSQILGRWPNTYAFTKALAEDLIRVNSDKLPIGIFRPAIVTSSVVEPFTGWIDNLYGPTGVVAGAGTGILRTMHCNRDINANIVPVDMTVNALIVAAWDVAASYQNNRSKNNKITNINNINNNNNNSLNNHNQNIVHSPSYSQQNIPIYNYVSSVENPLTWGDFTELNIKLGFEYPFSTAIWYISFHMHKSALMNKIYMIFLHFLPAMLIDSLAMCVGQKPRLLKYYKKIHKFSAVIAFFCTNVWYFKNDNIQKLWLKTPIEDRALFNFDIKTVNWKEYLRYYIKGMRQYLFKEDLTTLETARKKWRRLYWIHQSFKLVLRILIIYFFWSIFSDLMG